MRLILLPGLDGTGRLFSAFIRELNEDIQCSVIAYPHRKGMSYLELSEYVSSKLPKNEPYAVLAESFSGPVGYLLARQAQPNLRTMIFVASFLRNPNPRLMFLTKILPVSMLLRLSPPNWLIRKWMLGSDVDDESVSLFKSVLKLVPREVLSFRMEQIKQIKLELGEINLPVYYIQALRDMLVSDKCAVDFYKICPALRIEQIEGPHFILQSKASECAKLISAITRDNL